MKAYGLSDIGVSRIQNQDYLYFSTDSIGAFHNLFLVADGMGGHNAGDYASRFVVENLLVYAKLADDRAAVAVLREGIGEVNAKLYASASEDASLRGTGTTLVAATVADNTLYVANVGDSRLYIFRDGKLCQVTRDHSYVEELVALGQIQRDSQEYRKRKNIITRAVGTEPAVNVDFFDEQLIPGDLILMCSDGLSNMVPEEEICHHLERDDSLNIKVEQLIKAANEHGGKDNITVILVDPQIREVSEC